MNSPTQIRQEITTKIATAMRNGTPPWRMPWRNNPHCGLPVNFISKRRYTGVNPLLLMMTEYASKYWATYKQWQSVNGQVRRGEKATTVVFYKTFEKEEVNDDGETETNRLFLLRHYSLFNLEQVEGERLDQYRPTADAAPVTAFLDWKPAEDGIRATGAEIRYGGNRAYYTRPIGEFPQHVGGDFIVIPERRQFAEPQDWYGTHAHELCHWTEPRRGWSGSYAMGELVAEIGATYLASAWNVPASDDLSNHESYVASWLKEMEADPKWIFRASTEASKAADFILAFSGKVEAVAVGAA